MPRRTEPTAEEMSEFEDMRRQEAFNQAMDHAVHLCRPEYCPVCMFHSMHQTRSTSTGNGEYNELCTPTAPPHPADQPTSH
jgi:hypothetical protein